MGSLATLLPTAHNASPADPVIDNAPDELNDLSYLVEVLRSVETERHIEQDLTTRAAALGISIPAPPSPTGETNSPGPESDATLSSTHARNTSSGSDDTTGTAMTSNPPSRPDTGVAQRETAPPLPNSRARSRSLNFSTYDKYLAQLEPNLCQPKIIKRPPTPTDNAPSLFSVSTRKSYISIKNGLKAKVRWKRQSTIPSTTLYVQPLPFAAKSRSTLYGNTDISLPDPAYAVVTTSISKTIFRPCRAATPTAETACG